MRRLAWIGDQLAALARYAKPSVADDFRRSARFYRLTATLGSSREAAQVLELSPAEVRAAKGRVGRYEISLCLGDGARMRG
jgi:hypothetical protein